MRTGFGDALAGTGTALARADRLCRACVDLLEVDGASITLLHDGASRGTFGSSGALSRRLDELQFTFGEGPCLDAVEQGRPVLVAELAGSSGQRWPAFTQSVLESGVAAVFALPVALASSNIGALDLFRLRSGPLSPAAMSGALLAARLAAVPLLDLVTEVVAQPPGTSDGWDQLAGLERVEVYQATGMIIDLLDLGPLDALARIRAHAYAHGMTASETSWAILGRTLILTDDRDPGTGTASGPAA